MLGAGPSETEHHVGPRELTGVVIDGALAWASRPGDSRCESRDREAGHTFSNHLPHTDHAPADQGRQLDRPCPRSWDGHSGVWSEGQWGRERQKCCPSA